MTEFKLGEEEYIPLCDLMKATDLCESGGAAKHIIAAGRVKVDGAVETRKRCKIRSGQTVDFEGKKVTVA